MIHPIDKEQKISILLATLAERYNAQHIIRERVQNIGIWALGLLLGAGGWLIQSGVELSSSKKLIFIIGILVAFIALRFKYISDLQIGFKSQQVRAIRIEKTLGLFTPGIFDSESDSIYPTEWEHAGTGKGGGKFFDTTYLLLYIGIIFLIVTILLSGVPHHSVELMRHIRLW
jgi:hypothetical protein